MKNQKLTLIVTVVVLVMLASSAGFILQVFSSDSDDFMPNGISLIRPVIAQEATFLDQEAGISVYSKTVTAIDLASAEAAFRVIEQQTSAWIIGTVEISGETEEIDPHVFVHQSGWIVSYYPVQSPIAKALHWTNLELGSSHLEQALASVADTAGVSTTTLGFYDFEFPAATKWMVIKDSDDFDITIPPEFSIYELSYNLIAIDNICCNFSTIQLDVDSNLIREITVEDRSSERVYGFVPALSPGAAHSISLTGGVTPEEIIGRAFALSLLFSGE